MAKTSETGTKRFLTTQEDRSTPSTGGENTRNAFRDLEERMMRLEDLNNNLGIALSDRDIQIMNLQKKIQEQSATLEAQRQALVDYDARMDSARTVARERLNRIQRAIDVLALRDGG